VRDGKFYIVDRLKAHSPLFPCHPIYHH
jgi:hypothetical protein